MSKFYGKVGYIFEEETEPGIFEHRHVTHYYRGNIIADFRRISSGNQINDNIELNNKFSIIADPFACLHFHDIRYVEYLGTKWKVTNVEPQYPRLILTAGGVYNG